MRPEVRVIKSAEDLAVGDVLPDGRTVAAPPVVEGRTVRVASTWRGDAAPDRAYTAGQRLVVNIESA